jgi:diadenosine tetraphosphatase ApaH/serine/threonine PP2A family protein phosphatase
LVDLHSDIYYRSNVGTNEALIVFSDIHSNLEALQAVLDDLRCVQFSRMLCLGDIVGYAASPMECTDLVRSLDVEVLQGNHDFAVIDDPTMLEMTGPAALGIQYARKQLSVACRNFLATLPLISANEDIQFVHSSLDHPENWTYLRRELEIREHFKAQTHPVAFCGHTHVPAVLWWRPAEEVKLLGNSGRIYLPEDGKILINAGSVGQPRDRCPDACYVIYDAAKRHVEFRRVPYNIEDAKERILQADLPRITAERLSLGK